jgi:predicted transcriptional regulator
VVKRAETEYGWKRTTVYTLLKRMNDKGIVVNENAVVTALISRDEFFSGQSRGFVDNTFNGSLPMFITAFIKGGKLSSKQAEEIRRLIDESGEGDV